MLRPGAGALAFPGSAAILGWAISMSAMVIFGFCSSYAGVLLSRCKSKLFADKNVSGYADLAALTVGPRFGTFTRVMIVGNWALLVPYYVVTASLALQAGFPNHEGWIICNYSWTAVSAVIVILPLQLTTLTEISYICGVSTLAIVVAIGISLIVLASDGPVGGSFGAATTLSFQTDPDIDFVSYFGALGTLVFGFMGQDIFCEIVSELEDEHEAPKTISFAYSVMTCCYAITTIIAYGYQGKNVDGFLPNALCDGWLKAIVNVLVVFHVWVAILCCGIPLLNVLHAVLFPNNPVQKGGFPSRILRLCLSVTLMVLSYLFATCIPAFTSLQGLLGALVGVPIIFGWPPTFFLLGSRQMKTSVSVFDRFMCWLFLIVFLPVFTIFGTYDAARSIHEQISNSSPPFEECTASS